MPVQPAGGTEFRNLRVSGIGAIGGNRIPKAIGNTFAANLTFQYQGPGGSYDVGFGFAPAALVGYQNMTHFFYTTVSLGTAPTWVSKTVTVGGVIPADMAPGLKDCLAWIQTAGGPRDPGGNGYRITDGWQSDVYEITSIVQFQNLTAVYA